MPKVIDIVGTVRAGVWPGGGAGGKIFITTCEGAASPCRIAQAAGQAKPECVGDQMLPGCRVVACIPVFGRSVGILVGNIGFQFVGNVGLCILGPVLEGHVCHGVRDRVSERCSGGVSSTVWQCRYRSIVDVADVEAAVTVPYAIGHQNMVGRSAGISGIACASRLCGKGAVDAGVLEKFTRASRGAA